MPNKKDNNSKFKSLKIIFYSLKVLRESSHWVTPELAAYIGEYMERHPEQKLTPLLRYKLKLDFYRENKKKRKEDKDKQNS